MIGIYVDARPLMRAYSIASSPYEARLEFLSIKVPGGPLTPRLQHIVPGDTVLVGRKPTGTLLLQNLKPGRNLYLLASGTGLAPFMRLVGDPDTYAGFDRVVRVHGCRLAGDLALPMPDAERELCMVCGSPAMLADTRALLERLGFDEGSMARQGSYVIERAFVDR
jgi:ferredoxin--NADP+ reductase